MIRLFGRTKHLLLALIVIGALLVPATAAATDGTATGEPTPVEQTGSESTAVAVETATATATEQAQAYIVQLHTDVSVDRFMLDRNSSMRNGPRQHYSSVINGFAADLTSQGLADMQADARVVAIMPDFEVHASNQTIPTGVRRVGATTSGAARINGVDDPMNVDVAILDTGVSAHPDLRISGGVNCVGGSNYSDDHGHGTHVAGIVAAIDNGIGVVGVAPGARIWSVKVLNSSGSGSASSILCGIDWITARAGTIEVANMSLGGQGYLDDNNCGMTNGDIIHQAICRSVTAGVTYVVAAGNDGTDAAQYFPANYGEVITVSALVDTDGLAGGLGASTSAGNDDTLASFSNYGADVDVIAPGVAIYSTSHTGGYETKSGTSMAAPHVAGAAALYQMVNPGATPAEVRSALIAGGSSAGWSGDMDSFKEPMINVSGIGGETTTTPQAPTIDAQVVSVSLPRSSHWGGSQHMDSQQTGSMLIRAAHDGEDVALTDLALRSAAEHWGYSEEFMAWEPEAITVGPEHIAAMITTVLEQDGRLLGFYVLRDMAPGELELSRMMVEPGWIGCGYGRRLWEHAVEMARRLGVRTITIDSDPNAETFYQHMGAVTVGEHDWTPPMMPDWRVKKMRFTVPD